MCSEWQSAIVHAAVQLGGKTVSMLSIHSPDYVFTVLVSIFMKTHNHFWVHCSVINMFTLLYKVRVMEFSGSITRACTLRICTMYVWWTYASSTMSWHSGAEAKSWDQQTHRATNARTHMKVSCDVVMVRVRVRVTARVIISYQYSVLSMPWNPLNKKEFWKYLRKRVISCKMLIFTTFNLSPHQGLQSPWFPACFTDNLTANCQF